MKKKLSFAILLILTLCAALIVTGCKPKATKPQTLEEYAAKSESIQKLIDSAMTDSNIAVEIKGNDIIYAFDLNTIEDVDAETVKDERVVKNLQKSLDSGASNWQNVIRTIQDETGLTGVRVIVNYQYEGETVVSQTFTESEPAVEDSKDKDADSKDGESKDEEEDSSDSEDKSEDKEAA